ncbi:MAG: hypothetical protein AAB909_00130 [Patescibacteria group bacterium]
MSNNKKSGVHEATIVEFDGRVGKAYIGTLERTVRIHHKNWMCIQDSWITNEPYSGPAKLEKNMTIVLMIGRRGWARRWGLSADYTVPQAKTRSNQAPWHMMIQGPQPAYA